MLLTRLRLFYQRLGGFVSQNEKTLLALLSVVIVVSGTFWYKQYSATNSSGPTIGGTYVEGIIGGRDELEVVAAKLTKAGLFYLNNDGAPQNLLVTSYEVNADQTEYRFSIKDGVSIDELNADLQNNLEIFGSAVTSIDGQTLILSLEQPNPNVPILLTQPLFDYGPYKLTSITEDTAIFSRSGKVHAKPTYINKIIIHAYPDEEKLNQALSKKKIDGTSQSNLATLPKNYSTTEYSLTKNYALIFNVNVSPFRNQEQRKLLLAGDPKTTIKAFTLIIHDDDECAALADQLSAPWVLAGIDVDIVRKSTDELNSVLVGRTFQAVITGVDYTMELDPYYIWSSTQIRPPGNNVSGIKSDLIDQFLTRLRSTTSLGERKSMMATLNSLIQEEGAGKILSTESSKMVLSNNITFVAPFSAQSVSDYYQTIHLWSVN